MEQISQKTRRITTIGLLLAMALVLSFLEHQLPPLPPPFPPSMRFGLSNVIIMYTLFFMGWKQAYLMAVLKSLFVMLQRGPEAAFMSIFGGLLSVTVLCVLLFVFRRKISYLLLSISGAIAHNIGQMIAASLQFRVNMVMIYLPFLLIAGALLGSVTGMLLKTVMPLFHRISGLMPEWNPPTE